MRASTLLVCWCLAVSGVARAAEVFVKAGSWAETMVASRVKLLEARNAPQAQAPVTLGPWHVCAPLPAKSITEALAPEQKVDLKAKDAAGKPLWQKQAKWADGAAIELSGQGKSSVATYLYRTIESAKAAKVQAGFGSDDGIEVFLNGKKIHSNNAARGVEIDSDRLTLELAAGVNHLLVKIYNRSGGHGFAFNLAGMGDPSRGLWRQISRNFPEECGWMMRDLPKNDHLAWFVGDDSAKLEGDMLERVLADLGPAGEEFRKQKPGDSRGRLDLYAKASAVHAATAKVRAMNLAGLRLAITDLAQSFGPKYPKAAEYLKRVDELQARAEKATAAEDVQLAADADKLRAEALLANPLIDFDKLLLVKRGSKQLGLPQNWQGNTSVPSTGYENEIAVLSPVRPDGKLTTLYKPEGGKFVGDVDLHFDADRMLFSMPGANDRWQVWEMKADGSGLRQVSTGEEKDVDDYDACYLPSGKIMFCSTRVFHGVPCVGGADAVGNLCVMDENGKGVRMLCFDQDHNWCPTVLNDGRVMYTRWEYSDTAHYFTRILFRMSPDGSGQLAHYGSNSYWPNSLFYARAIPNDTTKVVAIVSGHHGVPRMGELVVFDTQKGRFEADGVVQRIPGYGKSVEPIIKDELVDGSWPKFLHPYPLSDKHFIVSMQPKGGNWGLYLVDAFDNMVLLQEAPGYALFEPVPVRKTVKPPVIPDRTDPKQDHGTVYISDIYSGPGLKGIPRGTVKSLRISEPHYSYNKMGGHMDVGVEGPWDVRRILGTVPVAPDGSAAFKAPANTPITITPLDAEGKGLQIMRSWYTSMPGEVISCMGCHEGQNDTPPTKVQLTATKPHDIQPWLGPARGFSFKRDVQPALDKYCVGCHDETAAKDRGVPDLTRKDKAGWKGFTPSYLALHPYVRRPGPESDDHLQVPMEFHADTSELVQMLRKGHHDVKLDAEAWDRLITWIDLNVPDHGTWNEQRACPENYDKRRLEMRIKYAGNSTDPEAIPDLKQQPVEFVRPKPVPEVGAGHAPPSAANWPMTAEQAKKLQAVATVKRTVDLGNGQKLEMVLIPAGEFVMGEANGEVDERPLAKVKIARPFWMGTTEITNAQFRCFEPAHDSGYIDQHHKDHTLPGYPANEPDQPAVRLSWHKAMAYSQWLSQKTGQKFNLPTEAQWEWACRAGSDTPFWYGGLDTDFGKLANLSDLSTKLLAVTGVNPQPMKNPSDNEAFIPRDNRFDDGNKIVAKAGQYQANPWGLLDMHGNVAEWTRSLYKPYPYSDEDGRNAVDAAGERAVRGGSWYDRPKRARSAFRLPYRSYHPVWNVGFRVICEVDERVVTR